MVQSEDINDNINEIKQYLKKIYNICDTQAVLSFGSIRLIDKARIDDLLCCFISMIPKQYLMVTKDKNLSLNCKSIIAYNEFSKSIKTPFFLNKNLYLVDYKKIENLLSVFIAYYQRDIIFIKNHR